MCFALSRICSVCEPAYSPKGETVESKPRAFNPQSEFIHLWLQQLFMARIPLRARASSQYNAMRAMWGVKHTRIRRNRLRFYSCVSCVHTCRIVNRTLVLDSCPILYVLTIYGYMVCRQSCINDVLNKASHYILATCHV